MRTRIYILVLLALAGCGWRNNFGNNRAMSDPTAMTATEKEEWRQRWRDDNSSCLERGYALQTYGSSWSAYQGTGGGVGGSQFNQAVYNACMDARGWPYTGRSPTVFGQALY